MEKGHDDSLLDLVIVIPTLNEEKGIGSTIDSINKSLAGKLRFEILVVDNNSVDNTIKIAKSKGVTVIKHLVKGYGNVLQAGFHFVDNNRKTLAVSMVDADGTYEVKDIITMVQMIKDEKADFVIGNRFANMNKDAMSFTNKFGNKVTSILSKWILRINIVDFSCGMRTFRSDLLKFYHGRQGNFSFAIEMLAIAQVCNAEIKEIPTSYYKRIGDTKLNPLQDGATLFTILLRLMRDIRPRFFFGGIGIILTLFGVMFGLLLF